MSDVWQEKYEQGGCLDQTVATYNHIYLRLPDKGLTINELVVLNGWDLKPLETC